MIIEQPVMGHEQAGVQSDFSQEVFPTDSLVPHVMQSEADSRVPHPQVLIHFIQKHWHQCRLPVVAMDDIRMLVRLEHEFHRRPAEKREPFSVVVMPVKNAPVEEISLRMWFDEEAFQAIHPSNIHIAMNPLIVVRHPKVAIGFGQTRDPVIARTVVLRQDDLDCVAANGQFFRQAVNDVRQTAYSYPLNASPTLALIPAERHFRNIAPEAALFWQADKAVRLHARIGTGYGIPQATSLFVTSAGVPGNNTALKTQKNVGIDVGAKIALGDNLHAEVTVYQEWFRNELISQSAGIGLLAYAANASRSIHRGVELGIDWKPLPGLRLAGSYSYNDHHYTRFEERLSAGPFTGHAVIFQLSR